MSDPSASPILSSLPAGAILGRLLPGELALVLANARLLERRTSPLERQSLLRGKNLALICASANDADAQLFQRAALDLGAHVAHIRPDLSEPSSSAVFQAHRADARTPLPGGRVPRSAAGGRRRGRPGGRHSGVRRPRRAATIPSPIWHAFSTVARRTSGTAASSSRPCW
jgi:hypothetical protein